MTASVQLKFYVFIILFQRLIGLAPYSYNKLKKKFVTSKLDLIYPLLLMLNFCYFNYALVCKYSSTRTVIIAWIVYDRFSILLTWFIHCTHRHSIVTFFRTGFHLNDILKKMADKKGLKILPTLFKAGIVTVFNSGVHFVAISGTIAFYEKVLVNGEENKFTTYGISFFTFVLRTLIPFNFHAVTLIAKLYFKKLNYRKYKNE